MVSALLVMDTFTAAQTYLGGQLLRTDVVASELSVSPIAEGVVTVAFEGRAYEIETSGTSPDDTADWTNLLRAAALVVNQDAALDNAHLRRNKADALSGIALATWPPLFVLVLGASLLWAVRGFAGGERKL